jgi:hypothetical protein
MLFYQFPSIAPFDLYLIFEKSSCKNQVQQTGFSACKNNFEIDFGGYTGSKNPV